jgi:hypothetical protein
MALGWAAWRGAQGKQPRLAMKMADWGLELRAMQWQETAQMFAAWLGD